jgi:hypothetical protein
MPAAAATFTHTCANVTRGATAVTPLPVLRAYVRHWPREHDVRAAHDGIRLHTTSNLHSASHVTRHTSHVTCHTSHVTNHVTRYP